ncbi:MAG TPA: imelysin family protein [Stenomitos sp.]
MSHKAIEIFLALGVATSVVACNAGDGDRTASSPSATVSTALSSDAGGEGGEGGEKDASSALKWGGTFEARPIVAAFADQVVVPQYKNFSTATAALAEALNTFATTPNTETLTKAREAWKQARSEWERTESFAFGPAGSLGYDGAMDSWPINEKDIQALLSNNQPLTPDSIAQMQDGQKGMHTIEYLLFGSQNQKTVAQFSDRERQYLQALGKDLNRVSGMLLQSWTTGVEGQPPYRMAIATAGDPKNAVYPTLPAGGQEMVTGMIDCINEVAAEKLATPMQEKSAKNLESRFSQMTRADLIHNIEGARAVYLGAHGSKTADANSLSTYVAKKQPQLDQVIQTEFQAAITALEQLPTPLETHIAVSQSAPQLQTAQAALTTLQKTLEEKLVPLI